MDEDRMFKALVLQGLWVLILCAWGRRGLAWKAAVNYQSAAIGYMDIQGAPGEEAKKYRREVSYGGILGD